MIRKNDLVGEWELNSFEIVKLNQSKVQWSNGAHGILIYTENGYMSVSINGVEQDSTANQKNLFYAGTYLIDRDTKIIHHVMNATDTNRIGKDLIRSAVLKNGTLTLIGNGDFGTATLKWNKIKTIL